MQIDFNRTECMAMEAYRQGNIENGQQLQSDFIKELKQSIKNGEDFCPCLTSCDIHGKCMLCVQLHRGHGDHLPYCLQLMLNKKLIALSELSEHTIINHINKPEYLE